jgi:hypothetical protein
MSIRVMTHRIAMACAIAAIKAKGETIIDEAQAVSKSYPDFYADIKKLGVSVIDQTVPIRKIKQQNIHVNSFGRIFRVHIFGESHGESVGLIIDGCPAGLPLMQEDFITDMERRKGGQQKGTTPRKEDDIPIFKSGVFNNKTTGAPIAMFF